MPESLVDLAFGVETLNDRNLTLKFPGDKGDRQAQDLFMQKGRDLSDMMEKDVAKWREVQLSRDPAGFTGKRSPAIVLEGVDSALKSCVIADIRVASNPIPLDEITSKVAAQNWLATEGMNDWKRVNISRELLAWMTLKGAVTVSDVTVPGSKVNFSYTFPVTTHAPAATWATDTTLIASSELDLKETAYNDACGLQLKRCLIDHKVHGYMKKNKEVQAIYAGGGDPSRQKEGTVLGNVGTSFHFEGIDFDVTREKYNLPGTGLTKYLGTDGLIGLPSDADLPNVLARAEGFGAIPTTAIGFDSARMGVQAPNRGEYSYALMIGDPAAVVVIKGWRGIFILTYPEAVLYDDSVITP